MTLPARALCVATGPASSGPESAKQLVRCLADLLLTSTCAIAVWEAPLSCRMSRCLAVQAAERSGASVIHGVSSIAGRGLGSEQRGRDANRSFGRPVACPGVADCGRQLSRRSTSIASPGCPGRHERRSCADDGRRATGGGRQAAGDGLRAGREASGSTPPEGKLSFCFCLSADVDCRQSTTNQQRKGKFNEWMGLLRQKLRQIQGPPPWAAPI